MEFVQTFYDGKLDMDVNGFVFTQLEMAKEFILGF